MPACQTLRRPIEVNPLIYGKGPSRLPLDCAGKIPDQGPLGKPTAIRAPVDGSGHLSSSEANR